MTAATITEMIAVITANSARTIVASAATSVAIAAVVAVAAATRGADTGTGATTDLFRVKVAAGWPA